MRRNLIRSASGGTQLLRDTHQGLVVAGFCHEGSAAEFIGDQGSARRFKSSSAATAYGIDDVATASMAIHRRLKSAPYCRRIDQPLCPCSARQRSDGAVNRRMRLLREIVQLRAEGQISKAQTSSSARQRDGIPSCPWLPEWGHGTAPGR